MRSVLSGDRHTFCYLLDMAIAGGGLTGRIGVLVAMVIVSGCGASSSDDAASPSAPPASSTSSTGRDCSPRPLETFCASTECPATLEDTPLSCGALTGTWRYDTDCGGTAVSSSWGFGAAVWHFDDAGVLTGVESVGDVGFTCDDGTTGFSVVYGTVCAKLGEPSNACDEVCGGPPLTDCGDEPTCPTNFADLPIDACDEGGQVTSSRTACGGTLATTTTGDGLSTHHCFDPWGRLIGIAHEDAGGDRSLVLGVDCEADGLPRDWCRNQR